MKFHRFIINLIIFWGILFVLYYILYTYPSLIAKLSDKIYNEKTIFDKNINYNGKLLDSLIDAATVITIIIGSIYGFRQLMHVQDNNLHEKYKTGLGLIKNCDDKLVLCGIKMLHTVALSSKEYRNNIKSLLVGMVENQIIEKSKMEKYIIFLLLISKKNIYNSLDTRNINGTIFSGLRMPDMLIENLNFLKCHFIKVKLDFCKFNNVIFEDCVFSDISFKYSHFSNCQIINSQFIFAKKQANNDFSNATFHNVDFISTEFSSVNFDEIEFYKSRMKYCSLEHISLKNSSFSISTIHRSKFKDANLDYATYNDSIITNSDFTEAYSVDANNINKAESIYNSVFKENVKINIILDINSRPHSS